MMCFSVADSVLLQYETTPLVLAAVDGDVKAVEYCIATGSSVDEADSLGYTALHWAATQGHRDAAELLIRRNADVNVRDTSGHTPLMASAKGGHKPISQLLLEHGADKKAVVGQLNAAQMAAANGQAELAKYIEQWSPVIVEREKITKVAHSCLIFIHLVSFAGRCE